MKKTHVIILAIVLTLVTAGGLWWSLFRHVSYYPTSDTIKIHNGEVSVVCAQDADCFLLDPTTDFSSCNKDVMASCPSPLNEDRAVNTFSFQQLQSTKHLQTYESCNHYDPGIEAVGRCLGGWFPYVAKCVDHRCAAIRIN